LAFVKEMKENAMAVQLAYQMAQALDMSGKGGGAEGEKRNSRKRFTVTLPER
jgi:hypothetical protein